ncbi:MAG: hypothetical protein QGH20_10640, partial [Candidatus Latescibacteria bacterium]|nr:hypothetical protein [Candidatus Latescibacterota bacterium]
LEDNLEDGAEGITNHLKEYLQDAAPVIDEDYKKLQRIALGEMIAEQLRKAYWSRLLTAPAGVLALWAVGQIPYIGPLVLIGSVVAGMGALKVVILKKDALAEDAPAETVDDEREE